MLPLCHFAISLIICCYNPPFRSVLLVFWRPGWGGWQRTMTGGLNILNITETELVLVGGPKSLIVSLLHYILLFSKALWPTVIYLPGSRCVYFSWSRPLWGCQAACNHKVKEAKTGYYNCNANWNQGRTIWPKCHDMDHCVLILLLLFVYLQINPIGMYAIAFIQRLTT